MIPPVVQPGDEFQRVRMPDSAGVTGKYLRIASVSGDLVQLEWTDAGGISPEDLDANTEIIEVQRKSGSFPQLDSTKTKFVWTDWYALQLFTFSSGSLVGIGSAAIGHLS